MSHRLPILVAAALAAVPATAQEPREGATLLGRIVLGAGAPKVAIDTPQAVTVIDREDIDRQQAVTPAELFDEVPGVQAIGTERVGGLSFNIRGVGEQLASDESKIIVVVDGAVKFHEQYRVGSFFSDPELFRRVEVLRGPASSTLYGAGALGGAIVFETRDAGDLLEPGEAGALRLRFGYETNGDALLGSVISASRVGAFEVLTALNYRTANDHEDGDGDPIAGSAFDAVSGLLKATWRIDEARSLRLSYTAFDSDVDDTAFSQTETQDFFGTVDRRILDQTATLSWRDEAPETPALDLDVTLSYSDTEVVQDDAQLSGSALFEDAEYAYRTLALRAQNTSRLAGTGWDAALTYGVQLSRQERVAQTESGDVLFQPEGTDRKLGLFGQAEVTLGRLTLIPGARLDVHELEPSGSIEGAETVEDTTFSPKLAALYEVSDAVSVFGSVARTERVATLDELFSTNDGQGPVIEPPALRLEPETSNAFEIGASFEAGGLVTPDDALALKATAFHYDIENLIERSEGADTPFRVNVGSARLSGVELEGSYEADRAFARLAAAVVDGEDEETGETLSSVPAESLVLTLGGRLPERGVEFGWQGTFVGGITIPQGFGADDTRFGGHATHDLFLEWSPERGPLEGTELRLGVDNVLDKDFRNSLAGDDGPGRSFKVTLTRGVSW